MVSVSTHTIETGVTTARLGVEVLYLEREGCYQRRGEGWILVARGCTASLLSAAWSLVLVYRCGWGLRWECSFIAAIRAVPALHQWLRCGLLHRRFPPYKCMGNDGPLWISYRPAERQSWNMLSAIPICQYGLPYHSGFWHYLHRSWIFGF